MSKTIKTKTKTSTGVDFFLGVLIISAASLMVAFGFIALDRHLPPSPPSCILTNAQWSLPGPVDEGTEVIMIVHGSNCTGETINFKLYDIDDDSRPDLVPVSLGTATFEGTASYIAFKYWTTEWFADDDSDDDPEYVFNASLNTSTVNSNASLKVLGEEILPTGDPQITNISGDIVDGNIITINGFDFGDKDPVEPYKYDNFDQGAGLPGNPQIEAGSPAWRFDSACAGSGTNLPEEDFAARYSTEHQRFSGDVVAWQSYGDRGAPYNCYQGTNYLELRRDTEDKFNKFYFSTWTVSETNGEETYSNVRNAKILSSSGLASTSLPGSDVYPNSRWDIYPYQGSGHTYIINCYGEKVYEDNSAMNHYQYDLGEGVWNRFEYSYYGGQPAIADGYYFVRKNGAMINDNNPNHPSGLRQATDLLIRDTRPICIADRLFINHYYDDNNSSPPRPTAEIYHSEIYVDITPARVELCQDDFWDDSTEQHCEIQIPRLTWENDQIQIELNQGELSSGYLFVINSAGNVSQGYGPISF